MRVSDFDYYLPEELIAQDPLEKRDSSRLLTLDKVTGEFTHRHFYELPGLLRPGDCLVMNNTKVIPARLYGTREDTGASIELLLLKRIGDNRWESLVKPGKKCREGARFVFGNGELKGLVESVKDDGNRIIRFTYEGIFEEVLDRLGQMPTPPYITHELKDRNRYQTVYARYDGSAAAPTAGLHFTEELLDTIKQSGIKTAQVTLHVGLGTFRPVKEEEVTDHKMHEESYQITPEAADTINSTRREGGRIVCVGTTSARTLESASLPDGTLEPGSDSTSIFIYPGYKFKCMDALITNFHLPKSTLIMLVSAFAGREHVLKAYEEEV
ncbi:MAG: tRNA preQ1(34) S-adenosylmethionine ribosyltransferase-isomerase QueA, partial [Eubacterium sp.]|nr:tRNA preQ1(34) S-adenosylmethionine ribosyltransferase-isomerase QueA [Eubacterium sp.]